MNIFFSLDDHYVPYMSVLLASMLEHASDGHQYILHILSRGLKKKNCLLLEKQIAGDSRFSMEFVDVERYLGDRQFYTESRKDLNQSIYYRLLIPYMFPELDEAVYLDGDMIALTDIAQLENVKTDSCLLAAVRDYQGLSSIYTPATDERRYYEEELELSDVDEVIISGLLVLNMKAFREKWSMKEMLDLAGSREWRHHDQDILNVLSAGNKILLDARWNILPDIGIYRHLPDRLYEEWRKGAEKPYVIHFGGDRKPWQYPNIPYAKYFWHYAKKTPFLKEIRRRRIQEFLHSRSFRLVFMEQVIVPFGSRRRAAVRRIWRSIRPLK